MSTETTLMVLQDTRSSVGRSLQFWAQGGGYTTNLRKAELFSIEKAQRMHLSRETDVPLRLDYLVQCAELMVDCQYLRLADRPDTPEKLASHPEDTLFYAVVPGVWDGNAVYFVPQQGLSSPDVMGARLFTLEEAQVLLAGGQHTLWPQAYIEEKMFLRVPGDQVNPKRALAGTGIKLTRPRKPLPTRYNCGGCGKFRSERQYYGGTCSCGWWYQG